MEAFWKEYTITLPSKKEHVFDIQNEKTNCVFIQNHNIANVLAGTKPHSYEIEIPPNRTSIINRPFPIEYVYFYTEKQTPVTITETITQNPIASFIQQKVTKNVSVNSTNVIIQNIPFKICQLDVFKPQLPELQPIRRPGIVDYLYDLGNYPATTIYFILFNGFYHPRLTRYRIFISNDKLRYIQIKNITLHHQHFVVVKHTNNAFRYIRVRGSNAPPNYHLLSLVR